MAELAPVEALPVTAAAIVDGFRAGNDRLVLLSLDRLRDETLIHRGSLRFRSVRFDWRFHIARQGARMIFFFIKRDSPVYVVLDATVSFGLHAGPPGDAGPALPGIVAVRWVPPPFLEWPIDPEDLQRWATPRATARDTLIVRLGSSVLVVEW